MKKHITVTSFNTSDRNRIGGGRWDVTGEKNVLLIDGLPHGVAVFPANGSRQQRCAVCASAFREHGYIAVRGGQWRPCCSDACLDAQLAKIGLTVAHIHAGSAPAEWTDFDTLSVTEPEMTGARVTRDGADWQRRVEPAERMERRELQSLARDWTARDQRAALARAEAEALADGHDAQELLELLRVLGTEHQTAARMYRECRRAWRAARTQTARVTIAAQGEATARRMRETQAQFRAVLAALETVEARAERAAQDEAEREREEILDSWLGAEFATEGVLAEALLEA